MLTFYNTLSRKKEVFKPIKDKQVGLYTCGPTVYWYAHIGNLRTYIFEDILKRVLEYSGYKVKHIMNITDVGHLTSDSDTGEDKMEKGAKREKKTVWEVAEFYTNAFINSIEKLNIKKPHLFCKATDYIKEQIELLKTLENKGFAYVIEDGVYFNGSKLKSYGMLWGKKKEKIKPGARVEMVKGKKNSMDFALWKFTPKGVKREMEWDSPWGRGFPGWHTECVVIGIKNLGIPFDIHCGGIDHIRIHHTNEIAQAEAAYGIIFANYWLHGDFLVLKEGKMAKSGGNIIIVDDLIEKGFNPLAYRYLSLTAHYRAKLTFSFDALAGADTSLNNLYQKIEELQSNETAAGLKKNPLRQKEYKNKFLEFISDDLNMPNALALAWKMLKDKELSNREKYRLLLDFDKVFGLGIDNIKKEKIPEEIKKLANLREEYRKNKQWQEADEIRKKIEKSGYQVEDTSQGPKIGKI